MRRPHRQAEMSSFKDPKRAHAFLRGQEGLRRTLISGLLVAASVLLAPDMARADAATAGASKCGRASAKRVLRTVAKAPKRKVLRRRAIGTVLCLDFNRDRRADVAFAVTPKPAGDAYWVAARRSADGRFRAVLVAKQWEGPRSRGRAIRLRRRGALVVARVAVGGSGDTAECEPGLISERTYRWRKRRLRVIAAGPKPDATDLCEPDEAEPASTPTGGSSSQDGVNGGQDGVDGGRTAPVNVTPPAIIGRAAVGTELSCSPGRWDGATDIYYHWDRVAYQSTGLFRWPSPGFDTSRYTVRPEDLTSGLQCSVVAVSASRGTTIARSAPVTAEPQVVANDGVGGDPVVSRELVCRIAFAGDSSLLRKYRWTRDGATIVGANVAQYTVEAGDVGRRIGCASDSVFAPEHGPRSAWVSAATPGVVPSACYESQSPYCTPPASGFGTNESLITRLIPAIPGSALTEGVIRSRVTRGPSDLTTATADIEFEFDAVEATTLQLNVHWCWYFDAQSCSDEVDRQTVIVEPGHRVVRWQTSVDAPADVLTSLVWVSEVDRGSIVSAYHETTGG